MSAPTDEQLIDYRGIVREFVQREVDDWRRRRRELVAMLERVGLDYIASTFDMQCPYCHEVGGGNCELCARVCDGPPPDGIAIEDWLEVDRHDTECWLWRGRLNSKGYAVRTGRALHRVYYAAHNPAKDISGLVIHHTCRVKHCVNPSHLESLTRRDHGTKHYREANP